MNYKIVYYGCGLCGKTTNIQYIHRTINPEARGKLVSIATEEERTLYFDFLPLTLGTVKGMQTRFHLYTVPGQSYYNASRKLVLQGVDGVIFVADSQIKRLDENVESYLNLWDNLIAQGDDLTKLGFVIQMRNGDLTLVKVLKNTPAQRAGIRARDVITKIEEQSTVNMDLQDERSGVVNIGIEGMIW